MSETIVRTTVITITVAVTLFCCLVACVVGWFVFSTGVDRTYEGIIEELEDQPGSIPAWPTPVNLTNRLSGHGPEVTHQFTLNRGLVRFEYSHNGDRNFIIWLLNSQGEQVELIANEIGPCEGSSAWHAPSTGKYLLEVDADGNWTIVVSQ